MNKPVFILGNQKSGTSLLTALLDSHKALNVLPLEVKLFKYANIFFLPPGLLPDDPEKKHAAPIKNSGNEPSDVLNKIINGPDFSPLHNESSLPRNLSSVREQLNVDRFLQEIRSSEPKQVNDIYKIVADVWSASMPRQKRNTDKKRFVENTPNKEEYASVLKKWYPDCKFIHIIRNPYANVYSLSRNYGSSIRKKVLIGSGKWSHLKDKVFRLTCKSNYFHERNKYLLDDYKTIKYEDLVTDTETEMKDIASFLSIQYSDILGTPTTCGIPWKANSRTSEVSEGEISSSPATAFKKKISPIEVFLVNKFFEEFMQSYGYNIIERPSIPSTLQPVYGEGLLSYVRNRLFLLDNIV